jgi:16S rRNA processing protein RimM
VSRRVAVGRVGRLHGLDGSFTVESGSADPERFVPGARLFVGGEAATVVARRTARGRPVIRLDRAAPRGALLEVSADDLPELPPGEFYAFELEGLVVEEDGGVRLGRVQEVAPGVANDVLELDTGLALPLVEECVRLVDREAGRIVVTRGYAGS